MWFWNKRPPTESVPFPGLAQSRTGESALYATERLLSDVVVAHAAVAPENGDEQPPLRVATEHKAMAAMTTGFALTGQRTAAVTGSLGSLREDLYHIAGRRLACVIHLVCHAVTRHTGAVHGSHDEYHDIAGAGFFQLFAANAQEVVDFCLLAHRIAELSLVPGLCAQDFYRTSHGVQPVRMPEAELVTRFAGASGDTIPSPTPAQQLLFGEQRRRIPLLLNQDQAAGIGAVQDRESFFRAVAAQRAFFYQHLGPIVEQAFAEFAELTGRRYTALTAYHADDAEYLVVAQGAVCEELGAAVDLLRANGVRAGLVKLNLLRPFPGAKLARLLLGKRAITVLERCEQPLAEDLPLMREVRSALDKAQENGGATSGSEPWPDYPGYRRPGDRPAMYSGVYGVGADLPPFPDLAAVYRNMRAGDRGSRRFFVGPVFTPPDRHFPQLQTLQQKLNRDYPQLAGLSVSAGEDAAEAAIRYPSVGLHFLSSQGGLFAGNLLALALADALRCEVRTFPQGGLEQVLQPASVTLAWNREQTPLAGRPISTDSLLLTSSKLLQNHALLSTLHPGGRVIVVSNKAPEALRGDLPNRVRQLVESRAIQVRVIDSERLLAAAATAPAFIDQLGVWALLGAWLHIGSGLSEDDIANVCQSLKQRLGLEPETVDAILSTMQRAAQESVGLSPDFWQADERRDRLEADPPWTVKQLSSARDPLFDVNRFWHSVGYLYDNGEAEHTLSDPWLATGVIPAASSAFRDLAPYRLKVPRWLPENCTGCGSCWAACPEIALPPVVLHPADLVQGAIAQIERQGKTFIQLKRVQDPLLKLAYRLLLRDELDRYLTLGALLRDAFDQMAEQMQLTGDNLGRLAAEFDPLLRELENFPIARTDRFFVEPQQNAKNSGLLLGLTLNPSSCTGCGICVETCPEDAWSWAEQTAGRNEEYRHNWQLQLNLPGLPRDRIAGFVAAENTQSQVNRLLDRGAYHSMVAGDGIKTGNGARTAIHLLTASAESVMRQRFSAHAQELARQIERLEALVQGNVSGALGISDFDEFCRRLSRLGDGRLDAAELAELVRDEHAGHAVDPDVLRRQTALAVELKKRLQQYADADAGIGRARLLFAVDPGAASFWSGSYPYNPYLQPWVCHLPGGVAAGLAESLLQSIRRTLLADIRLYRRAELELSGSYDPARHDAELDALGWDDLSDGERQLAPPVFLVCGSLEPLRREITALLAGRFPLRIISIDQQALRLPGPVLSGDLDDLHRPQADHLIGQSSVGCPGHLIDSVVRMLGFDGPSLLHVYAPDPQASGFAVEKCIEQAALAAASRTFPLFRAEQRQGRLTLSIDDNPAADDDWAQAETIVRAQDGQETTRVKQVTVADWAVNQSCYRQHFDILPRGHLNETLIPLADYLELDAEQSATLQAYIDIADGEHRQAIAVVSAEMVAACELARNHWRRLRRSAAPSPAPVEAAREETSAQTPAETSGRPAAAEPSVQQQLTASLLELCGYSQDPEFFNRSLGEFIRSENQASAAGPENEPAETSE